MDDRTIPFPASRIEILSGEATNLIGSRRSNSWHLGRVVAAGFYRFPALRAAEAERCQVVYTTRSKNPPTILSGPHR
jgi:hypothetical protein